MPLSCRLMSRIRRHQLRCIHPSAGPTKDTGSPNGPQHILKFIGQAARFKISPNRKYKKGIS